MPVYVDDVRHRFGNMVMCHLWGDTLEELLLTDKYGPLEHCARLEGNQTKIDQIAALRQQFALEAP